MTLKTRLVMPAIHMPYTPEGEVTDRLIDFYVERADDQAFLPADTVVPALGTKPDNGLYEEIKDKRANAILIGDASSPKKAYDANHQAMVEALKV
jgi:2,4-dienoyl-CoA reductase-like NADH-dependent reductase (Old Yellow Enzyme family)